jgi:hypothetical protein
MKKLLLILFLLSITVSFAQQKEMDSTFIKKNVKLSTLSIVSAYPNPLTVQTQINFRSNKDQLVEFTVKNLLGKTVYGERINAKNGMNSILFNRDDLTKGMYIYSLQTETEVISKRLVIR